MKNPLIKEHDHFIYENYDEISLQSDVLFTFTFKGNVWYITTEHLFMLNPQRYLYNKC